MYYKKYSGGYESIYPEKGLPSIKEGLKKKLDISGFSPFVKDINITSYRINSPEYKQERTGRVTYFGSLLLDKPYDVSISATKNFYVTKAEISRKNIMFPISKKGKKEYESIKDML